MAVTEKAYFLQTSPPKKVNKQKTRHKGPVKPSKVEKSPQKAKKTSSEKTKIKPHSPQKVQATKSKEKEEVKDEEEEEVDEETEEEIRRLCYGSPWDATQREILKVEDLDLDKSYVEEHMELVAELEKAAEKNERPERRPRWKHEGRKPLTDISKLAKMGWDSSEPDLDSNDLEGQIVRCKERIEDNIMPSIFEDRLKQLEEKKAAVLEIVASEKSGLSWAALLRIKELQNIETGAMQDERDKDQLVNIRSILAAYRSQTLEWTGLVTYWLNGTQLCQPRPFNWDEYEAINEAHGKPRNFWVEGMSALSGNFVGASITVNLAAPARVHKHIYRIALRLPGRDWWVELDFLFDTGASNMFIYEDDLHHIAGPHRDEPVNVISLSHVGTNNGEMDVSVVELEATILDKNGKRMSPWIRLPAAVRRVISGSSVPGMTRGHTRVDGGVFRRYFYYMISPEPNIPLVISDTRFPYLAHRTQRLKDMKRFLRLNAFTPEIADPVPLPGLSVAENIALMGRKRDWPKPARGVQD